MFLLKCSQVFSRKYRFNNPENLAVIVSKLPPGLRERWNGKAFSIRFHDCREASLSDILTFVNEEASLASNPLFSKEALSERDGYQILKSNENKSGNKPSRSYGTNISCENCNSYPNLDCFPFEKLKTREKIHLIMKKRLCYSCLKSKSLGDPSASSSQSVDNKSVDEGSEMKVKKSYATSCSDTIVCVLYQ